MNVINVIGGTKNQRKLAEKIAWFCIKDMMPRYRTLDIEIQLRNCMKETEQLGCCYALETNREFVIEVEKSLYKKDLDDFARTICHEMIHVWQTARKIVVMDKSFGKAKTVSIKIIPIPNTHINLGNTKHIHCKTNY